MEVASTSTDIPMEDKTALETKWFGTQAIRSNRFNEKKIVSCIKFPGYMEEHTFPLVYR